MRDALSEALTTRLAPVLSEVVTRGEEVAAAVEVANEQLTALRLTGAVFSNGPQCTVITLRRNAMQATNVIHDLWLGRGKRGCGWGEARRGVKAAEARAMAVCMGLVEFYGAVYCGMVIGFAVTVPGARRREIPCLSCPNRAGGKGSALGPHQIDTYPQGDDQTSKLLADSRLLRAQLHTLSHFEPVYHTFEPQIEALMHAQTEEDARRIRSMQEEMLGQDVDVHGVEYEHARGSGQGQMLTTQPHDPISW